MRVLHPLSFIHLLQKYNVKMAQLYFLSVCFNADLDASALASPDIEEAIKTRLREEHARLDPFALKKSIEVKLKKFFTLLSNLNREATKT